MTSKTTSSKAGGVSSQAVQAKTGRGWDDWFVILDDAGAREMTHTRIARYLREEQGVSPWWSQMVANGYEQARGMREKHQMPEGYQISVSKTIQAPPTALYQAWSDEKTRDRWFPGESVTVRKATPNRSLRMTWSDSASTVEVTFNNKGNDKGSSRTQVVVQHSRLADSAQAERMKAYWREALERLKGVV